MDLSSTKCIDTINTILKPLETMTKTLNISARKPYPATAGKISLGGMRIPIAAPPTAASTAATTTPAAATVTSEAAQPIQAASSAATSVAAVSALPIEAQANLQTAQTGDISTSGSVSWLILFF